MFFLNIRSPSINRLNGRRVLVGRGSLRGRGRYRVLPRASRSGFAAGTGPDKRTRGDARPESPSVRGTVSESERKDDVEIQLSACHTQCERRASDNDLAFDSSADGRGVSPVRFCAGRRQIQPHRPSRGTFRQSTPAGRVSPRSLPDDIREDGPPPFGKRENEFAFGPRWLDK